jgi:hypothetical protein
MECRVADPKVKAQLPVGDPAGDEPGFGVVGLRAEVADRIAHQQARSPTDEIPVGLAGTQERLALLEAARDIEALDEEVSKLVGELAGSGLVRVTAAIAEAAEVAVGELDRAADVCLAARLDDRPLDE